MVNMDEEQRKVFDEVAAGIRKVIYDAMLMGYHIHKEGGSIQDLRDRFIEMDDHVVSVMKERTGQPPQKDIK
jgi:hypothetical protein